MQPQTRSMSMLQTPLAPQTREGASRRIDGHWQIASRPELDRLAMPSGMGRRMFVPKLNVLIAATSLLGLALALAGAWPSDAQVAPTSDLRPVASFSGIADPKARSVALFEEAGRVITHPRCVNCHPVSDRPLQGNAGRPHQPPIFATASGMGSPSMPCSGCHGQSNFTLIGTRVGSMPGNPKWQLAPREMAWQGKSLGAICRQIKDTTRNGGRDYAALIDHAAHDDLVAWGWHPGAGREPAPGTQEAFGSLVKAWIETGAECPA